MPIPKVIHFIWAGGKKLIPQKSIITIIDWLKINPDFQCKLWIDRQSYMSGNIYDDYSVRIRKTIQENDFINEQKQNSEAVHHLFSRIALHDISEIAEIDKTPVRYHINRLLPNYGSSSDLLRYLILYKEGGVYFDSDVRPSKTSLMNLNIFNTRSVVNSLYVDCNSQGRGVIGNDAIACEPNNALMKMIKDEAIKNHYVSIVHGWMQGNSPFTEFNEAYLAEDHFIHGYFEYSTIERTGTVVRNICDKKEKWNFSHFLSNIDYKDLQECINHDKRQQDNTRGWTNIPITRYGENIKYALIAIQQTIDFEVKHYDVLRLDDHVFQLAQSCDISLSQALTYLDPLLKKAIADNSNIKVVQLTCTISYTINWCQQNNRIMAKTHVDPVLANEKNYRCVLNACVLRKLQELTSQENIQFSNHDVIENNINQALSDGLQFLYYSIAQLENVVSNRLFYSPEQYSKSKMILLRDTIESLESMLSNIVALPQECKVASMFKDDDYTKIVDAAAGAPAKKGLITDPDAVFDDKEREARATTSSASAVKSAPTALAGIAAAASEKVNINKSLQTQLAVLRQRFDTIISQLKPAWKESVVANTTSTNSSDIGWVSSWH